MKKILKKLWGFIFILLLSCSNLSVCATEGTVSEISLYHAHSGSTSGGGCYNQPKYHTHAGNAIGGGNCYTPVYHTHQGDTTNGGSCYSSKECGSTTITPYGSHYLHRCTVCAHEFAVGNGEGEGYSADATAGEVCHNIKCSKVSYYLNCTKANTIESYNLSCNKTATTVDGYALNCGKTPSTIIGKLQLNKVGGVEYSLGISATNAVIKSCIWDNGETGQSIVVTGNKEYSCQVTYSIEGRTETSVLSYTVTDYDTIGPNVTVHCDDNIWERCKTITIEAVDDGVGLHNMAYRYSDGTIWSDWSNNASYQINANGSYCVEVRDALLNTTEKTFTITHIDTVAPEATVSCDKTNTIIVNAKDIGAGLHTKAYRYHNGTGWSDWSEKPVYKAENDGMHQIEIRDVLGNIAKKEIVIKKVVSNITTTAPNTTKPDKEEKVPETSNIKEPTVEKVPSKENENKKESVTPKEGKEEKKEKEIEKVTDKEEKVVIESSTINVKNAMSEPEKEESIYKTLTSTDEIEDDMIFEEKENESIETTFVQIPYDEQDINKTSDNKYSQMVCVVGIIGVPFLFFGCMGNTKIYGVSKQGKQKFLCRAFLSKRGKLKISRYYLKRNKSKTILIKPSKAILEKKCGKSMCIRIGEREFSKVIQEEILLEY